MQFFYTDVPRLGRVAVSRHAQARIQEQNIPEELFRKTLLRPGKPDIPDTEGVVWRESNGLRIVVVTKPVPDRGTMVVKTVYRIQGNAVAYRR